MNLKDKKTKLERDIEKFEKWQREFAKEIKKEKGESK